MCRILVCCVVLSRWVCSVTDNSVWGQIDYDHANRPCDFSHLFLSIHKSPHIPSHTCTQRLRTYAKLCTLSLSPSLSYTHTQTHTHTHTHTKPSAVEQPSVKVCWRCRSGGIYIDRWWRDYGAPGLLITLLRRRRGTPWCHSSLQGWLFTLDMSFVPFSMFYLLPS